MHRMNFRDMFFLRKIVYRIRNFENRHSYNHGRNNRITKRGVVKVNSRIQIKGSRNKLVIEKGCVLEDALIHISGNDNIVVLNQHVFVMGAELWVEDNNCSVEIREKTFIGHHTHIACTEGCSIIIGERSMISSYVQIRAGDSHSILDMEGHRLNKGENVIVGPHCWIGEGAKILKGVKLEGDDIVSTGAIVTKSFPKNVLAGGVPAKIIRENVNWDELRQ